MSIEGNVYVGGTWAYVRNFPPSEFAASLRFRQFSSGMRILWNRVLRRIFGPKRDEATGEWRRLHNEELNGLYPSPNIIRVIKSRRMRWVRHVARMEGKRDVHTGFW
jgi:hypothetical protein